MVLGKKTETYDLRELITFLEIRGPLLKIQKIILLLYLVNISSYPFYLKFLLLTKNSSLNIGVPTIAEDFELRF